MNTDTATQADTPLAHTAQAAFRRLRTELEECIIGQEALVEHLLIALLGDGHLLVEGAPGLAKTTAIKGWPRGHGDFHRLQFTPDLLPGDLTGTDVYHPQTAVSASSGGRYSTTWCWPTKSTASRPRYSRRCWKPWASARSPSDRPRTDCPGCSW